MAMGTRRFSSSSGKQKKGKRHIPSRTRPTFAWNKPGKVPTKPWTSNPIEKRPTCFFASRRFPRRWMAYDDSWTGIDGYPGYRHRRIARQIQRLGQRAEAEVRHRSTDDSHSIGGENHVQDSRLEI